MIGSLEADILLALRGLRQAPARQVRSELERRGISVAYTTVATCLARLYEKGLVLRTSEPCRGGERFVYESIDFEQRYLANLLNGVVALFGPSGVVHLNEELAKLSASDSGSLRPRPKG